VWYTFVYCVLFSSAIMWYTVVYAIVYNVVDSGYTVVYYVVDSGVYCSIQCGRQWYIL